VYSFSFIHRNLEPEVRVLSNGYHLILSASFVAILFWSVGLKQELPRRLFRGFVLLWL
jgi:hypothetical protein